MIGGLAPIPDRAGDFGEIAGLAEILVDRGEADVGNRVELAETVHHQFADARGADLALPGGLDLALHARDELVDPLLRDAALAATVADLRELGIVRDVVSVMRVEGETGG